MLNLLGVHVAGADDPDQIGAIPVAPRESQKHVSATTGLPDRKEPGFRSRMRCIRSDRRCTGEHALNFYDRDAVLLAFFTIALVPVKACNDFAIYDLGCHLYVRLSTRQTLPLANTCDDSRSLPGIFQDCRLGLLAHLTGRVRRCARLEKHERHISRTEWLRLTA